MNRRALLKWLGSTPAPAVLSSCTSSPQRTRPTFTRVRPSDPAWPSAASWEQLKRDVRGNLIPVSSSLAPCKDAPGSAACVARIAQMSNPYFIGDQPGGTQTSGWLDGWTSAPSTYAVVAHNSGDVVAAVSFARDHNLRLVVKGRRPQLSGHLECRRLVAGLDA
jgi:hypothetical protein